MAKTYAVCRIDGFIELRQAHPGDGYYALGVGEMPVVRGVVFATAKHQPEAGREFARRVPEVDSQNSDRENLGAIARYIQTLALLDVDGFRALGA